MKPSLLLLLCLMSVGCEPPWELIETGTTSETLRAAGRSPSGTAYLGGTSVHRTTGGSTTERITLIGPDGNILPEASILGILALSDGDVYAWYPDGLLHTVGNSLRAVDIALGGEQLSGRLSPTALIPLDGGQVAMTALVDGRGRLFEGSANGTWSAAQFPSMTTEEAVWLARAPDGTAFAGDGRNGASTLLRRTSGTWESIPAFEETGVQRAAVTNDHLVVLTPDGVKGFNRSDFSVNAELRLEGDFLDLCAFADGRVAVVGAPLGPLFPMWIFENGRWGNFNVGTREVLRGVHCGNDDKILAVGDHGMAVRQP